MKQTSNRTTPPFRTARRVRALALTGAAVLVAALTLEGSAAQAHVPASPAPSHSGVVLRSAAPKKVAKPVVLPPLNGRFDIQLGGSYPPAASVAVVDRDRSEKPVAGKYNICYINAFQTQDYEAGFWLSKHKDLLLKGDDGQPIGDPNWPGEYLLDTSTKAKRAAIATIEGTWIDGCAKSGFQAVDPDNLDTWTRSDQLTMAGNLALATLLATRAHADGLAISQKNASEIGVAGKNAVKFDFAIVESCQEYEECGAYTKAYGNRWMEIEYTDSARSDFTTACAARGKGISVILRDHDIVAKGQPGYHYEEC